ncbi:MAG: hypothetical protein AAB440_00460 [Patescibacteria group bacterium]
MHESLVQSLPEKYKDRFVVVEICSGGQSSSLLNEVTLPGEKHPLYLGIDVQKSNPNIVPEEGAPPSAMMQADITTPKFFNGQPNVVQDNLRL